MTEKRIMIVENERTVADELKRLLTKMGYAVTGIAASGEEAVRSVHASRPDLVLMDIRIDGPLDGIETAEHLYAEFNVPVSYLTAHGDVRTLERAKATIYEKNAWRWVVGRSFRNGGGRTFPPAL